MSMFDELMGPAPKAPRPKAEDHLSPAEGAAARADAPASPDSLLRLQRLAGNAAVAQRVAQDDAEMVGQVRAGGGQPLEAATRVQMEQSFGTDFSDVRVHTGGDADASARQLGAHAYTVGNDVVFSQGRYDPASETGQKTLAHELTHVVQQRSGPVDGTDTGTGVKVSDPSDRFERAAESTAEQVVAGQRADAAPAAAPAAAVQRDDDGHDAVQGRFVQRQGEEEEPEEVQSLAVQREGEEEEPEEVQSMAVQREGEEPAEEEMEG